MYAASKNQRVLPIYCIVAIKLITLKNYFKFEENSFCWKVVKSFLKKKL